ncbi:cytochrome p450 [Diplodia corticola]|uniref:Cytochrome p450 n=1 Tax=Diplodia corticola TaxID=236234 RepID=A0A1J9RIT3_9PEZI|nr:cytochrome p450 [Diplodia corticola]OJD40377.1 cytochrome p450 [Diplodia corticola]
MADTLRLALASRLPTAQSPPGLLGSVAVTILTLLVVYVIKFAPRDDKIIPSYEVVGMSKRDTFSEAQKRYSTSSRAILQEGLTRIRNAFQVYTPVGPVIVLPKRYTEEIKNHKQLSFAKNVEKSTFGTLPATSLMPGMAGFMFGAHRLEVMAGTARMQLTQSLGKITARLSEETAMAIDEYFPSNKGDWNNIVFYPTAVRLVSRLSALVFLGDEICRNEEWLHVSGQYAIDGIDFIRALRSWPAILQPIAQFFLPERRKICKHEKMARKIIQPVVDKRKREAMEDAKAGRPPKEYTDALQWLQDAMDKSGRKFDIVGGQLGLGLASIHTTSMALTRAIFDLCDNPEWVQPLRDEVKQVLAEDGGWKKTTLHKMKLMDSVLKESQRRNPVHFTIMTRIAEADVDLSGGVHVRKGDMITVTTTETMMDPAVFPEPERFIGDRFLKLRQIPGNENKWQYVTTSADHIGFGHGAHACPGRFFAGNELKIVLAHMLMKYDWAFAPGHDSRNIELAQDIIPNPVAELMFKERNKDNGS